MKKQRISNNDLESLRLLPLAAFVEISSLISSLIKVELYH